MGLSKVYTAPTCEGVKPLRFVQIGFNIDIALVPQELIEFLQGGSAGSLRVSIWLENPAFYRCVPDPKIFDKPIKFGLSSLPLFIVRKN